MKAYSKMKKRLAKKRTGFHWRRFQAVKEGRLVLPVVGQICNDCDGFNHRVDKIEVEFESYSRGRIIANASYLKSDGNYFCSCLDPVLERAWTVKEIEEFHGYGSISDADVEERRKNLQR